MGNVFCTNCGQANPGDARYCANCGTVLMASVPSAEPVESETSTHTLTPPEIEALEAGPEERGLAEETASAVEALPTETALLVVKRGPNAGSRFHLDTALTTAGRHPDSDIFLDDVTVSRRHAEFHREEHGFTVRDVGSLNGTYVNRERVERQSLASGDEVRIGKFGLVFLQPRAETAT